MVALVLVAEEIVVGGLRLVVEIVESADLLGLLHDPMQDARIVGKSGEDAEAPLRRLENKDVWGSHVADGHHADLRRLHLKLRLNRPLEGMLERDDPSGSETERLDRLDVESVGRVRCHQ